MKGRYIHTTNAQIIMFNNRVNSKKHFVIKCEPKSKNSIKKEEQAYFRSELKRQLKGKRKYKASLVLQIDFFVSQRNVPELQTLVKNYLDLMHKSLPTVDNYERILFNDDKNIKILCARLQRVDKEPRIEITTNSYYNFLQDIKLVDKIIINDFEDDDYYYRENEEEEYPLFNDEILEEDKEGYVKMLGADKAEELFEALKNYESLKYQIFRLTNSKIKPYEITQLFYPDINSLSMVNSLTGNKILKFSASFEKLNAAMNENILHSMHFLSTNNYPQKENDSKVIKNEINVKALDFKNKNLRLFPLKIPIKVSIYFAPPLNPKTEIDNDNLARKYVIPIIKDLFKPPTEIVDGINIPEYLILQYEVIQIPRNAKTPMEGTINILISKYNYLDVINEVENFVDDWIDKIS